MYALINAQCTFTLMSEKISPWWRKTAEIAANLTKNGSWNLACAFIRECAFIRAHTVLIMYLYTPILNFKTSRAKKNLCNITWIINISDSFSKDIWCVKAVPLQSIWGVKNKNLIIFQIKYTPDIKNNPLYESISTHSRIYAFI